MRVFVYFNLHKRLFSVRAAEGENRGKVIAHSPTVYLANAVFKVSEAGRQRVLREKRKNVHAGVQGVLLGLSDEKDTSGVPVTYNPYRFNTFVFSGSMEPVFAADRVTLSDRLAWVIT